METSRSKKYEWNYQLRKCGFDRNLQHAKQLAGKVFGH
jgi:hypothetical protein